MTTPTKEQIDEYVHGLRKFIKFYEEKLKNSHK